MQQGYNPVVRIMAVYDNHERLVYSGYADMCQQHRFPKLTPLKVIEMAENKTELPIAKDSPFAGAKKMYMHLV